VATPGEPSSGNRRPRLGEQSSTVGAGSLGERFEIASDYFTSDATNDLADPSQSGIMRLSCGNANCFAISLFDSG